MSPLPLAMPPTIVTYADNRQAPPASVFGGDSPPGWRALLSLTLSSPRVLDGGFIAGQPGRARRLSSTGHNSAAAFGRGPPVRRNDP